MREGFSLALTMPPHEEDLSDIDDDSTEEIYRDALNRLALRARLRQEARAASSSAAAGPLTSVQVPHAFPLRPQQESSDDEEGGEEEDVGPFSLPPGWRTVPATRGHTYTWTDGERTVGTITQAWELYNADRTKTEGAAGISPARSDEELQDDFVSIEALLCAKHDSHTRHATWSPATPLVKANRP